MTQHSENSQEKVMQEYNEYNDGILKSIKKGTGGKVRKPKMIIPIGLMEARIKGSKIPSNPINSL